MREFIIYTLVAFLMTQCPLEEHRFVASVNPSGSGTVSPDTAYYRDMVSIRIAASPGEDWEFAGWTGDTTSAENPLAFTISKDMKVTANFQRPQKPSKAFFDTVTVADQNNTMNLYFGMMQDATNGYDQGLDLEVPPTPPAGSFYGQFEIDGYNLRGDIRPLTNDQVVWQLAFEPEEGQGPVSLSWNVTDIPHTGRLILTDDLQNPTVEIDMKSRNEYQKITAATHRLYIISN